MADDWVILLDHSIQLGPDKLFVILGIREGAIDFRRPLRYQDLDPLWMTASSHWNGDVICERLNRLQQMLGQIKYAVGDYGSDIKKGLRLAGIPHVHDITHHIALILKKLYADDAVYQDVTQRLARIRKKFGQTAAAHLLPPKQRKKSRYHNLRPLATYGRHILSYLEQQNKPTQGERAFREAITWIRAYRVFFEEMFEVTTLVGEIERSVKHQGLSPTTVDQCCQILTQVATEKGGQFKADILQYFQTTLALTSAVEAVLCTSDILESAFGKYKNYVSCNAMAGITDLALCIAAFTCSLAPQELADALEHTRHSDVTTWAHIHIGPTLLQKRRKAFSESQK